MLLLQEFLLILEKQQNMDILISKTLSTVKSTLETIIPKWNHTEKKVIGTI